jgi:hypothetical protein
MDFIAAESRSPTAEGSSDTSGAAGTSTTLERRGTTCASTAASSGVGGTHTASCRSTVWNT